MTTATSIAAADLDRSLLKGPRAPLPRAGADHASGLGSVLTRSADRNPDPRRQRAGMATHNAISSAAEPTTVTKPSSRRPANGSGHAHD